MGKVSFVFLLRSFYVLVWANAGLLFWSTEHRSNPALVGEVVVNAAALEDV